MSKEHGIDGDEPLFHFDTLEGLETNDILEEHLDLTSRATSARTDLLDMSYIPDFTSLDLSAYTTDSTPAEVVRSISMAQASDDIGAYETSSEEAVDFKGKGKAASRPMDIQQRDAAELEFDLFSLSSPTSGSSRGRRAVAVPSSSASTAQTSTSFTFSPNTTPSFFYGSYETCLTTPGSSYTSDDPMKDMDANASVEEELDAFTLGERDSKGKARSEPPVLPPLTFSPSEFTHGETHWPLSPHSPDVAHVPNEPTVDSSEAVFPTNYNLSALRPDEDEPNSSFVPRMPSRSRSFSSLSAKSAKSLAARSVAKFTQSFSGGKRSSNLARKLLLGKNNDIIYIRPDHDTEQIVDHKLQSSLSEPCSPYLTGGQLSFFNDDIFIASPTLSPPPKTAPRNLFDGMLPRETKLTIFMAFLKLHEEEGNILRQGQAWTALTASKRESRWLGRGKGFIELVRLSRVSKAWQSLVFDGQLWVDLNLAHVPSPLLQRLAATSGSFIRSINLIGHTRLTNSALIDISKSMCIYNSNSIYDNISSTTQLTHVNLSGCSMITSPSLQYLLKHSPWLVSLKAKGLNAATNEICRTLSNYCPRIEILDLSRCHKVDCDGISTLMTVHQAQCTQSPLKELRIAGLRRVNDSLLSLLGRYAPNLEVLDLSNVRGLHNTALEAFVSCREDDLGSDVLILSSREAGRNPGDSTKYRRRVTKLRHLSLSSCPLLTDTALTHLAYAVPRLEFLELASIGAGLRDEGLIHLLETTPLLRRLDLEDACDITDATLAALTPSEDSATVGPPQPGSRLEYLILSYALQISNDATLALIRACTRLKHLELDNTHVSSSVVREFVRLCQTRQAVGAGLVAVDCRGVGENTIKDLAGVTRTRKGWRSWDARALQFLDERDEEDLGVGQDECDDRRIVLKSFYSWQTVDAVASARQKRRKAERKIGHDSGYGDDSSRRGAKWWSPGSRRLSGTTSPASPASDRDRESCIIM